MTEEIDADAAISMGVQPSGYTVWVNGPIRCRIRICGLTEEQAQSLRDGLLDITLGPLFEAKKLIGSDIFWKCPLWDKNGHGCTDCPNKLGESDGGDIVYCEVAGSP